MLLLQCTDLFFFLGKSPWKRKFSTTTFNFSFTLNFCITVKTQETRSKYGQTLKWPRPLWSSYLMCLILCILLPTYRTAGHWSCPTTKRDEKLHAYTDCNLRWGFPVLNLPEILTCVVFSSSLCAHQQGLVIHKKQWGTFF